MAYGTNAPFGLKPILTMTGAAWNGQLTPYLISSSTAAGVTTGYATSLFKGDPVIFNTTNDAPVGDTGGYLNTAGTIARYEPTFTDATPSTWGATPIVGVFQSCEWISTDSAVNNVRREPYWPAAAQVAPGTPIIAHICDDPMVVYDVQLSTHVNANGNAFYGTAPVLPIRNPAGNNAADILTGSIGSNFALNIGGGTNFDTIQINGDEANYANNPQTGDKASGSAFYVDVATWTGGLATHDYNKTLATLPVKAIWGYSRDPRNIARANPVEFNGSYTRSNTPFLNILVTINNHAVKTGTPGVIFA